MIKNFELPDLGEGLHEAEITEILVSQGASVTEGDLILMVETDKAAVEIPSPYTGQVAEIHVKPGERVEVGSILISFETAGDAPAPTQAVEKAETQPPQKPAAAQKNHLTESATPEVPKGPVAAAPSTRRLAREMGIDIKLISGSGPGGRVTDEDVRNYSQGKAISPGEEKLIKTPAKPPAALSSMPPGQTPAAGIPALISSDDLALPDFSTWGETERIPLRSIRRAVARRMVLSWSQIPHVSHHDVVDITELENLRQNLKKEAEGENLTLTVFAIKAVVAALKQYPRFNASLDTATEEIILKHYYNIGVAVDTERGLIVPVIKNASQKNLVDISTELNDVVQRTRGDQNNLDELQGGTFTITNAGVLGGTHFSPIINYPQVAILGMAKARWQPVVRKDEAGQMTITPRLMLPLILTFDHRVVDGGDGARFMNTIIKILEDPQKLLLWI